MKRTITLALLITCAPYARAHEPAISTSREGARMLPLPKEKDVFHFIIFGDRTGGPAEGIKVLKQAVKDTNLLDPDLVMTVGDLVQGYNTTPDWLKQMKEFRGVMGNLKMPWFPVAGNHDVYWRGPKRPFKEHEKNYEMHFGPLWYWFKHKNAGFVVLYTDEGDPKTGAKGFNKPEQVQMSREQLDWLAKSLKEMKELDHVFVFLHHPRWVEQWYKGSNWPTVHKMLAEAVNVKAVFAGHIHRMRYDGKKDGIEYFALATTGGGIPGEHPKVGYLHHFNVVTVRKDGYAVAGIPVGGVIDPRQFTALRQKDVDLLRTLKLQRESKPIEIGLDGESAGYYRFSLTNPASRPIEVTVTPESPEKNWLFIPDHRHVTLQPGKSSTMEFAVARRTDPSAAFHAPHLDLTIDYLEEAARVRVPPRKVPMHFSLRSLPKDFHVTDKNGMLALTGKGDALRVSSAVLKVPQGAFTAEAWISPTRHSELQAVIAKTEQSEFGLTLSNGRPRFEVFLDDAYVSVQGREALKTGRTVHLAGVYDGESLHLYVDGSRVATTTATGTRKTNALPLFIGAEPDARGNPNRFFNGKVDEVRISRGARYEDATFKPAARFEPDNAALLLLHLDRHVGPFAVDHSSMKAHALRVGPTRITK